MMSGWEEWRRRATMTTRARDRMAYLGAAGMLRERPIRFVCFLLWVAVGPDCSFGDAPWWCAPPPFFGDANFCLPPQRDKFGRIRQLTHSVVVDPSRIV